MTFRRKACAFGLAAGALMGCNTAPPPPGIWSEIEAAASEQNIRLLIAPLTVGYSSISATVIPAELSMTGQTICRLRLPANTDERLDDGHLLLVRTDKPHLYDAMRPHLEMALTVHEAAHCFDSELASLGITHYHGAEAYADTVMALTMIARGHHAFVAAFAEFRGLYPQASDWNTGTLLSAVLVAAPGLSHHYEVGMGTTMGEATWAQHLQVATDLRGAPDWGPLFAPQQL